MHTPFKEWNINAAAGPAALVSGWGTWDPGLDLCLGPAALGACRRPFHPQGLCPVFLGTSLHYLQFFCFEPCAPWQFLCVLGIGCIVQRVDGPQIMVQKQSERWFCLLPENGSCQGKSGFPPAALDILGNTGCPGLSMGGRVPSLAQWHLPRATVTMSQRWPNSPRPRGSTVSPRYQPLSSMKVTDRKVMDRNVFGKFEVGLG